MQKTLLNIILIGFVSLNLTAQGTLEYEFVINNQNGVVSNLPVEFLNGSTGKSIVKKTNNMGYVKITMTQGVWTMNLPQMPKQKEFTVNEGYHGRGSMTVYYNPDEYQMEQKFQEQRASTTFDTVKTGKQYTQIPKGHVRYVLQIIDDNRRVVKNLPVKLVSIKQAKIYSGTTNNSGLVTFFVPLGENYGIDIGDTKAFTFTDKQTREGTMNIRLTYEPAKLFEIVSNDTIAQASNNLFKPYDTHAHLQLEILKPNGTIAPNENVYLNQIIGNKIYKGKTDDKGMVNFLLPLGDKYMIHFDYRLDVDVIDLRKMRGLTNYKGRITYRPDERLLNPEMFLPTTKDLFIEEYTNFIEKTLPTPTDKAVELYIDWGNSTINEQSREAVLEIGIAANNTDAYKNASPSANLMFVLDRSGSMAGYGRIEALKTGLSAFVNDLRPHDKIGVISFNNEPFIETPLKPLTNKEGLKEKINAIDPSGGTNIHKALMLGYKNLQPLQSNEKTSHIVLLSDGYGVTEPQTIVDSSKKYNQQGIGLSAIGVGNDYNYALLTLLSDAGKGFLAHSGTSAELVNDFKDKLSKIIYPVAKDVTIEIIYNNNIVYKHIYGTTIVNNSKGKAQTKIDKLYAGQNNIAIAHFKLENTNEQIENTPVILRISYYDLIKKETVHYEKTAKLNWEPYTGKNEMIADGHLKKLFTIAIINQSLKIMAEAYERNDIATAMQALQRTTEQINNIYPEALDNDVERLAAKMAMYLKSLEIYAKANGIEV